MLACGELKSSKSKPLLQERPWQLGSGLSPVRALLATKQTLYGASYD